MTYAATAMRTSVSPLVVYAACALLAACGARTDLDPAQGDAPAREPRCGDGVMSDGEACDDADLDDADGCLGTCVEARCGDGVLARFEGCDDGNQADGDGCRSDCTVPSCGDGLRDMGEECDEGAAGGPTCTPLCRAHLCGDGYLEPNTEACDEGAANEDRWALVAIQAGVATPLVPHALTTDVASFYDYRSASSHTGLEGVSTSRVFFAAERSGLLSLLTIHGVDEGLGPAQPKGKVQQRIEGLPAGWTIAVADDRPEEFFAAGSSTAVGDWGFSNNTDGGVMSDLPFPGAFVIEVTSTFEEGIDTWQVVDAGVYPTFTTLDEALPLYLVANATPSACRTDCSVPRCGDGWLDGGERCDDANDVPGDGCTSCVRD